jgi:hypothetical protein
MVHEIANYDHQLGGVSIRRPCPPRPPASTANCHDALTEVSSNLATGPRRKHRRKKGVSLDLAK